jgi:hypothetical protein
MSKKQSITYNIILFLLIIFVVPNVTATSFWDRPAFVLNLTGLNDTLNYLNMTFSQDILDLQNDLNTERQQRIDNDTYLQNQINALFNFSYYINTSFNTLNQSVYNMSIDISNIQGDINDIENDINDIQDDITDLQNFDVYVNNTLNNINTTINNIAEINVMYEYVYVNTSSGDAVINTSYLNYEITNIKVVPNSLSNKYNFEMYNNYNLDVIDKSRKQHTGIWDIDKQYSINSTALINISNADIDENFTIRITFLNNGLN